MFLLRAYFCTIFTFVVTQIYVPAQTVTYNAYETKYAPDYTNYKPKNYAFKYGVSDPQTGDHKSQWEKRENGVTIGMYSLLEPDGSKRIVEYVADRLHGFRALVRKIPLNSHQPSMIYSAGYNTAPSEETKQDSSPRNENENTHEAVIAKSNEPADEGDENDYEKQAEGPINKETEEVDTHRKGNDEENEDAGYTDEDHEDEKNEDDESNSYSSYKSYDEDEEDE